MAVRTQAVQVVVGERVLEERRAWLWRAKRSALLLGVSVDFLADVAAELEAAVKRGVRVTAIITSRSVPKPSQQVLSRLSRAGVNVGSLETAFTAIVVDQSDVLVLGAERLAPFLPTLAIGLRGRSPLAKQVRLYTERCLAAVDGGEG